VPEPVARLGIGAADVASVPREALGAATIARSIRSGLWRLGEVADYLAVSERQVRREVAAGHLPCVRIGRRLLFDPSDVSRFVAARKE